MQLARTPEKMKAKKMELLYLHDQQTAGIPGINLLFLGMKMRTTEKIWVCNATRTAVLKHSSCVVIGWELHPGDQKQSSSNAERQLQYIPPVIFVRFENADWEIDSKLGRGVLPMYACHRTWTLNRTSGATIIRKGHLLVPDYASTAFMMQGSSLDSALAECGDITDLHSITEIVTAYVILSRLTTAGVTNEEGNTDIKGLLLLRAFSPSLFTQGPPPGPHCLLTLLRDKFANGRHNVARKYTIDEARADYARTTSRSSLFAYTLER